MKWIYLFLAVTGEIIGTSALKSVEGFTRIVPTVFVIFGYSLAFYFLSLTLRYFPIGIVYAIWCGVGIVLISIIGLVFFKQSLDMAAIIGIGLILMGVLTINLLSKNVSL